MHILTEVSASSDGTDGSIPVHGAVCTECRDRASETNQKQRGQTL